MIFKFFKNFILAAPTLILPISISCNNQKYYDNSKIVKTLRTNNILRPLNSYINSPTYLENIDTFIVKGNKIYKNQNILNFKQLLKDDNWENFTVVSEDLDDLAMYSFIDNNVFKFKKAYRYLVLKNYSLMELTNHELEAYSIQNTNFKKTDNYRKILKSKYANKLKFEYQQDNNNLSITIKKKEFIKDIFEYNKLLLDDSYQRYAFNLPDDFNSKNEKIEYLPSGPIRIDIYNDETPKPIEILEYTLIIPIDEYSPSEKLNITIKEI
ncbi:hypothetical protein [Mycoplasma leonicaptivi]|uniref:hypothetical protein n=1 Tax=Mycoplasma leonicaptivi TaxID=36742 RepID=UPI000480EF13|nr:hypothetical protein [Mycoplasma leonicaptivi]